MVKKSALCELFLMLQCLMNYTFCILSFHALSQTCFSTKSNSLHWLVSQGPWNYNCCHLARVNPVVLSQAMRECSLCTYGSSFRYLSISVTHLKIYIQIIDAVPRDSPAERNDPGSQKSGRITEHKKQWTTSVKETLKRILESGKQWVQRFLPQQCEINTANVLTMGHTMFAQDARTRCSHKMPQQCEFKTTCGIYSNARKRYSQTSAS